MFIITVDHHTLHSFNIVGISDGFVRKTNCIDYSAFKNEKTLGRNSITKKSIKGRK